MFSFPHSSSFARINFLLLNSGGIGALRVSAGISIFLKQQHKRAAATRNVYNTLKKTPPKKRVFVMATSASSIRIPFLFFPPFLRSSSTVYPFDPFRARRKARRKNSNSYYLVFSQFSFRVLDFESWKLHMQWRCCWRASFRVTNFSYPREHRPSFRKKKLVGK